eukprot:TRINITY_DN6995_c1_g1_i3.p1 TRINITY_DN6995_c1_g1~~TRINITY_DN6995_c1_g1_i3.p1  ORF type:complete len:299 (+),score=55.10 TRINITY_DN6995_c1_g1_i3:66-962(+)
MVTNTCMRGFFLLLVVADLISIPFFFMHYSELPQLFPSSHPPERDLDRKFRAQVELKADTVLKKVAEQKQFPAALRLSGNSSSKPASTLAKSTIKSTRPRKLGNKTLGLVCHTETDCIAGLKCDCLALNRGLKVCLRPGSLDPPSSALKDERQGLSCDTRLPQGAKPMQPPPLVTTAGKVIDPGKSDDEALVLWARKTGHFFYSKYILVHHPSDVLQGIPIIADASVRKKRLEKAAETVRHLLIIAAVSKSTLSNLAHAGVRLILAGEKKEEDDDDDEDDENTGKMWLYTPSRSQSYL